MPTTDPESQKGGNKSKAGLIAGCVVAAVVVVGVVIFLLVYFLVIKKRNYKGNSSEKEGEVWQQSSGKCLKIYMMVNFFL